MDDFQRMQRRAREALENPLRLEPKLRGRAVLRLWHSPAFSAWSSWLFVDGSLSYTPPMLRQVIWDAPLDNSRFLEPMTGLRHGTKPVPTLDCRDFALDRVAAGLLESLSRLTVPIDGKRHVRLDGESFGFELHGSVRAQWESDEAPWGELAAWFEQARAKIQAKGHRRTAAPPRGLASHATGAAGECRG